MSSNFIRRSHVSNVNMLFCSVIKQQIILPQINSYNFFSFSLFLSVKWCCFFEQTEKCIYVSFALFFSLTLHLETSVKWQYLKPGVKKAVPSEEETTHTGIKSILAEWNLTFSSIRFGCWHTVSFNNLHLRSFAKAKEAEEMNTHTYEEDHKHYQT